MKRLTYTRLNAFRPSNKQAGVSLLEVLISLLIFSIGVLGIVGLHATASKDAGEAQYRAVAASLSEQLIAQYWTNKTNINSLSPTSWETAVKSALPSGEGKATYKNQYLNITVCWQTPNAETKHCHETATWIGINGL